jgi:hypothetical protein
LQKSAQVIENKGTEKWKKVQEMPKVAADSAWTGAV